MYEDVGIRKEIAIQKLHRVMNEEVRHGSMSALQAHQSGNLNEQRVVQNLHQSFLMSIRKFL